MLLTASEPRGWHRLWHAIPAAVQLFCCQLHICAHAHDMRSSWFRQMVTNACSSHHIQLCGRHPLAAARQSTMHPDAVITPTLRQRCTTAHEVTRTLVAAVDREHAELCRSVCRASDDDDYVDDPAAAIAFART